MESWHVIDSDDGIECAQTKMKVLLSRQENGLMDVPVDIPFIRSRVDVVTPQAIIQVKPIDSYTTGIGELLTYKVRFSTRKLILFLYSHTRVHDKKILTLQNLCAPYDIHVEVFYGSPP